MSKTKESTELAVSPELAQELAQFADEEAALERPGLSNISLRSGIMKYLDEPMADNQMDVIVVGVASERSFYATKFDPDNITPPACFALSLDGHEMGPTQDYGFGNLCQTCKNNEWGSADTGRGKACSERRRLVIAPADVLEKGTFEGAEMAMLKLPVTSVRNWGTYINKLRSGIGRPMWSVITNIKIVPDAKTQFKVLFSLVGPINDPDLLGELRKANKESDVYTMQPFDMAAPEPQEAAQSDKF